MIKFQFAIPLFLLVQLVYGQNDDQLIIKSYASGRPIKNVNVIIPLKDTVLISDTSGVVNLSGLPKYDTLIVKKFGYNTTTINKNTRLIDLKLDSNIYSHDLKLVDLKHKEGYSFIKLRINGDDFWYKQKSGPLILGNGKEIETIQDYKNLFKYHKILKTVSVASERCLFHIIGENSGNWIMAIYYNPQVKRHMTNYYPNIIWYSKRHAKKDGRILKLTSGCLD